MRVQSSTNLSYACIFSVLLIFSACIGDDIIDDRVPEEVRVINVIDSLQVGMSFQLEAFFFNNVGSQESRNISWSSSDENVLSIDQSGLAEAVSPGLAIVRAEAQGDDTATLIDEFSITVTEDESVPNTATERTGTIQTTSFYILEGSMVLKQEGSGLVFEVGEDFRASSSLPGLYVYLTNNPNTINGALELGEVTQFEGAHSYDVPGDVALGTYQYALFFCKPFTVKVGDGEFTE